MENIIKVKLGDIKSRHLHYSMESLLGNEKVNIFKVIIECLFILLFGLVWVLFTILFHKRCFHFFKKYIKSDYINPITYETLGNGIFSRTISIIISLFLLLFTFPLIISKIMDNLNGLVFISVRVDYDWVGLYERLKDSGYEPNKHKRGYIKVQKFKGKYLCRDGNHRHRILLDMYGPDKIIDVIYDGISYHPYYHTD